MLNLESFLKQLEKNKKLELWIEKKRLRYRVPRGALTEAELNRLKKDKQKIMGLLWDADHTAMTCPASQGQKGLYFIQKFSPENRAYNAAFPFQILSEFKAEAMKKSLQTLLERHSCFRTVFFEGSDGELFQNIYGYRRIDFEEIDSSGWSQARLEKEAKAVCKRPFDLNKGPLLRAYVFSSSLNDHLFLMVLHHIIFDGWSMWIMLDELRELYSAQMTGESAVLPPIKAGYADFVDEQSRMLNGARGEKDWNYWKERLSGDLPTLNLSTDYPRPPTQISDNSELTFLLRPELKSAVKSFAAAQGVTVYVLLLAVYKVLLYRCSNQKDILVASPAASRSNRSFENTIGYFVNLIVVRSDFTDHPDFECFLARTQQAVLEAIKHQFYPFSELVRKLPVKRDLSYSPLVQTLFVLQKPQKSGDMVDLLAGKQIQWAGLNIKIPDILQPRQHGAYNDLEAHVIETSESFSLRFHYSAALFNPETIKRMAGHFQVLLEGILADPKRKISELPLLTEEEKRQILVEWNGAETDYPKDKCVHQLFEEQVEKTPDNIAAVFEKQSLSYSELNAKANQLARHLRTLGVGPETLVGVCVERSLEMLVGLLGIMKAGGAYVPLDPLFPAERISYMLETSETPVILSQTPLKKLALNSKSDIKTVYMDKFYLENAKAHSNNFTNPNTEVADNNLSYVMFTSGSTGKPKGVQISHANVVNFLNSMRKEPGFSADDTLLAATTISFDISVLELFLPIITGGKCVIASRESSADGLSLRRMLHDHQVTLMQATPAAWKILENSGWEKTPSLKILCGGEPLPPDLADTLINKSAGLWNMYGPTETTIWSSVKKIETADEITIGRPIDNTYIYILDENLTPAPVGVAGDLYIGGLGVSRGYLKRPKLTREKFIPNPFSDEPGSRLYKTGDLARYLANGDIEFLGRTDHQVKIRGFRIEPGEIEATLNRHEAVKEAVVVVREDQPGDKRLTAYVCLEKDRDLNSNDLRLFLKSKLPAYMTPSAFVFQEAMPLTPNGKIDREALPAPDLDLIRENEFAPPRNKTEETLVQIWAEVLGVDKNKISALDNFFEIGGHSLLAASLMSKIQKRTGKQLSIAQLFGYPSVRQLSELLNQYVGDSPFTPLHRLGPRSDGQKGARRGRSVFLTHAADGNLFHYSELLKTFDGFEDLCFYGLQAYGLEAGTSPLSGVEDMADKYLEAMLRVQSEGAYIIAGFSLGGLIAYELARQLKNYGKEVDSLILIDAMELGSVFSEFNNAEIFLNFLREFGGLRKMNLLPLYRELQGIELERGFSAIVKDAENLSESERLELFRKIARKANILSLDADIEYVNRIYQVYKSNILAMSNYAPKPYDGKLIIMKAAHNSEIFENDESYLWELREKRKKIKETMLAMAKRPALGWDKYCENIETHEIPGNHFSMLRFPYVKLLSEKIKARLSKQSSVAC